MIHLLETAYLTGALVMGWTLWFCDEWHFALDRDSAMRVIEIAIWPIAILWVTLRTCIGKRKSV